MNAIKLQAVLGKIGLLLGLMFIWSASAHAQYVEYIHTDALGTPVAVTNASRVVIERSEYEPFGKPLDEAPSDEPGYTGHVSDAATGLSYMQQRYYDPGIGRFLSVDPVTVNGNNGANFNRYWYAANNPYRFSDPDGRESLEKRLRTNFNSVLASHPSISTMYGSLAATVRALSGTSRAATVAGATGSVAAAGLAGGAALAYSPNLADGTLTGAAERDLATPLEDWKPEKGQPVFRIWGGGSSAYGASWTPVNPIALRMAGLDVRDLAGLPNVNSGQNVTMGVLTNPAGVVQIRSALPLDGNRGGLTEYVIPNPGNSVQFLNTFDIKPPY